MEQEHKDYINNCQVWTKRGSNKMCLEKWKSSRNRIPWCQEGKVQSTLSEASCVPLSLTVLGLVQSPEEATRKNKTTHVV